MLTNDTDIDGGPKSVASVTQPANGTRRHHRRRHRRPTYTPNLPIHYCNITPGDRQLHVHPQRRLDRHGARARVTCVDDNPVAVDDTATVGEDSGANAIDVLTNDTDIDGGPKSVASVNQPRQRHRAPSPAAAPASATRPNLNYCNGTPATDNFTYTLNGGSTATVRVTVTCADDAPVAVDDTATVAEDSGANAIDVLANDTDVDGGPQVVTAVTQGGQRHRRHHRRRHRRQLHAERQLLRHRLVHLHPERRARPPRPP